MRFLTGGLCALWITAGWMLAAQSASGPAGFSPRLQETPPPEEKLVYNVEWRLIRAGVVTVEKRPMDATVKLESVGLVSSLLRIQDVYDVNFEDGWCATSSVMDSIEGKRHHEQRVTYDRSQNHAFFVLRDVNQDRVLKQTGADIPNCVADVVGAFSKLRRMNVDVGQSTRIPVSDGRKSADVKVTAMDRERVKTPLGNFRAVRYEADLMNGVVYPRKGDVYVWLSDDAARLPVQIKLRTGFPIGAVTLELEKEEHP